MFCALQPAWKLRSSSAVFHIQFSGIWPHRRYVMEIPNQVIMPAIAVMFWNQLKTSPAFLSTDIYARSAKAVLKISDT